MLSLKCVNLVLCSLLGIHYFFFPISNHAYLPMSDTLLTNLPLSIEHYEALDKLFSIATLILQVIISTN